MNIRTHLKLAYISINDYIKVLPKGFSNFAFKLGIIFADNSHLILTHPHFRNKSENYINNLILSLRKSNNANFIYSFKLGIVIHYLCDYCCSPHSSKLVGNTFKHILYEIKLQYYLIKNINEVTSKLHYKIKKSPKYTSFNDITSILNNYCNNNNDFDYDIYECIKIINCAFACLWKNKIY